MQELGFYRFAKKDPNPVAIIDTQEKAWSRGELLQSVNQLSNGLKSFGLTKGDTVAILLPNSVEYYITYLACAQCGFYLVPINWHLSGPEVAYILQDSEAKVFITSGHNNQIVEAAKKAAEEAEKARLEKERTAVIQGLLDEGGYDSTSSKSDRDRSTVTESSAAATKGVGGGGYTASDSVRESQRGNYGSSSGGVRDSGGSTGGYSYGGGGRQGFGYGLADGGRVYYMDGGLADLVDIYD